MQKTQAQKRWKQDKLLTKAMYSGDHESKGYWMNIYDYVIKLLGEVKQREKQIDKVINDPDMDDATALQILTDLLKQMQKVNE